VIFDRPPKSAASKLAGDSYFADINDGNGAVVP
jgi:hypothetical protein